MQGVRKPKVISDTFLCNSQPNCTKNGHLSVKQLTSSFVPRSKISFLSLIFSTIYYTRCQKVLETIKPFPCPWKWKLQPRFFCAEDRTCLLLSWMTSIVTVSLKLILNNISLHTWKSAWNGKSLDSSTSLEWEVLKGAGRCLKQEYILLFKFMVEIKFTETNPNLK